MSTHEKAISFGVICVKGVLVSERVTKWAEPLGEASSYKTNFTKKEPSTAPCPLPISLAYDARRNLVVLVFPVNIGLVIDQ